MKRILGILLLIFSTLSAFAVEYTPQGKSFYSIRDKNAKKLSPRFQPKINQRQEFSLLNYTYYYYDFDFNYWQDYYRYTPTIVEDITTSLDIDIKNFDTSAWDEYYQYSYQYNEVDKLTETLVQYKEIDNWINETLETFSYNADNLTESYLIQNWRSNVWQDSLRINYYYEDEVPVREEWIYYDLLRNEPQYRCLYTVNAEGKVIEEIWEYVWDNLWYAYLKGVYSYSNELLVDEFWYDFIDNIWTPSGRYTYNYVNEDIAEINGFYWENYNWTPYYKYLYTYGVNDLLIRINYQEYSSEDSQWLDISKFEYFWELVTNIDNEDLILSPQTPVLFPNPFCESFSIDFPSLTRSLPETVSIYDIKGRKIQTLNLKLKQEKVMQTIGDLSALPSGIYFIKIGKQNSIPPIKAVRINK